MAKCLSTVRSKALLALLVLLAPSLAFAQQGPTSLNVSGGLFQANGSPIVHAHVNLKVDILDKDGTCVLYSEQHLDQDLSATKGAFSLLLGTGTSQINNLENSTSFDTKIFQNTGAVAAFAGCASGLTLSTGDTRLIRIYYDLGSSGYVAMTPDVPLASAPYAMVAESLQGKAATDLVQINSDANNSLTQANVEYLFSNTNYPRVKALVDGTSTQYISSAPSAAVGFNSQRLTGIANPTSAQDAATKIYTDTSLGGKTFDPAGVGAGIGGGSTIIWDQVQNKWIIATVGSVASISTGTGLTGGPITSTGTISVDVGVSGNKILQLNTLAQIPAVNGSLLTNVNAFALQSRTISTAIPADGQMIGWNDTTALWEPKTAGTISALTGDVTASGSGSVTATIANNAVTSAKINTTGLAVNRLLITDAGTGATVGYSTCALGEVLQWSASGWGCVSVNTLIGTSGVVAATYGNATQVPQITVDAQGRVTALTNINIAFPVTTVAGRTGAVTLNAADIANLGTAALKDYGVGANQLVELDASARLPAVDGSLLTNVNIGGFVTGGNSFGTTASLGTNDNNPLNFRTNNSNRMTIDTSGNVGVGTLTPNALVDIAGTMRVTTICDSNGANCKSVAGGWGAGGSVTNVTAGDGLNGGSISTSGTLSVDVGTAANKILQLNVNAAVPAVDGYLMTNINAANLRGIALSTTIPGAGQVLTYNNSIVKWEPATPNAGTVTSVVPGIGLIAGTITSGGTLNVDVGAAANKILQLNVNAAVPAVDGFLMTNVNAANLRGVVVSATAPTSGQVLTYNNSTAKWEAAAPAASANSFVNGGNTFGAASTIGNKDAFALGFLTNNLSRMTIDNGGNVGIGTTSPTHQLELYSATSSPMLHFYNNTGTGSGSEQARISFSINDGAHIMGSGDSAKISVGADASTSASYFAFHTYLNPSVAERMRIVGANVGIGTPSPLVALHIANNSSQAGRTLRLAYDQSYYNDLIQGGASGLIFDNSQAMSYTFKQSGSAVMTILGSGNVGIGTTSPTSKLEVNGTITATAFSGPMTSSVVGAGSGSNAAPSLSFSGDPDTGFYNASSNNTVSVAAGGSKIFDISSSGIVSATTGGGIVTTANGTAAAPTFSFAGDAGTGWWRPAASTMAGSTGGTERIRIDSSGNVGIGTTNPGGALDVLGANTGVTQSNSGALIFRVQDGNSRTPLAVYGGIDGTPLPDSVLSTLVLTQPSGTGRSLTTAGTIAIGGNSANGNNYLLGNVGIGTTTPLSTLHVFKQNNGGLTTLTIENNGSGTGTGNALQFTKNGIGLGGIYTDYADPGSGSQQNLRLKVYSSALSAETERLTILGESGNVGIGTISPAGTLDVRGGTAAATTNGVAITLSAQNAGSGDKNGGNINLLPGAFSGTGKDGAVVITSNGTNQAHLVVGQSTATDGQVSSKLRFAGNTVTHGGIIFTPSVTAANSKMQFTQGGGSDPASHTVLMTIQGNGNVGIGTTTPGRLLEIAASSANTTVTSPATDALSILNTDTTVNNTSDLTFRANDTNGTATTDAKIIGVHTSHTAGAVEGELAFITTQASLSGERMRIDKNGNVGIGTTGPDATLQVGAVTATGQIAAHLSSSSGAHLLFSDTGNVDMSLGVLDGQSALSFHTGRNPASAGTELMRLTSTGNVGIGTTNPSGKLNVQSGTDNPTMLLNLDTGVHGGTQFTIGGTGNNESTLAMAVYRAGLYTNRLSVASNGDLSLQPSSGNVGIGITNPSYTLHVVGTAGLSTGTAWTNASDIRLKDIHGDYENGLNEVLQLHTVRFNYKEGNALGLPSDHSMTGFIAQEVQKVIPEAVHENANGYLELNVDPIHWAVVNAVKQLKQLIDNMNERLIGYDQALADLRAKDQAKDEKIQKLEEENAAIKTRLERLEKRVE